MALATKEPTESFADVAQSCRDTVAEMRSEAYGLRERGTPESRKEAKSLRIRATGLEKSVTFWTEWLAEKNGALA